MLQISEAEVECESIESFVNYIEVLILYFIKNLHISQ